MEKYQTDNLKTLVKPISKYGKVDMAVCIAILDRNSTPLKLMTNDPSKEVNFHYIVHTSLDVISERCSTGTPSVAVNVKSVETTRDQYLGLLYSTEQYKVFGYITNVSRFLSSRIFSKKIFWKY